MNVLAVIVVLGSTSLASFTGAPYGNPWCWEGKTCINDDACKQDNGQNGHCCGGKCRKLDLVRGELCGSSLQGSACPSCGNNLACDPDGMGANRCQAKKAALGCLCNSTGSSGDAGCLSGNCVPSGSCAARDVFNGGACEENRQCRSNVCTNSTCQPIANGDSCTKDPNFNLCGTGDVCVGTKCNPPRQLGQSCADDFECVRPALYCAGNQCANRVATGQPCTQTPQCMGSDVCSNGTCTAFRSVAADGACSVPEACVSKICSGGKCKQTHFLAAGAACTADDECPAFGACTKDKVCTASSLGMRCNPVLGSAEMDAECLGSKDVFCACSGFCLPVADAILPVGNTGDDACKAASDYISKSDFLKDLTKVDVSTLNAEQKSAIATNACCQECGKDRRVSAEGFSVDCVTKTISQVAPSCASFAEDPLALSNCPEGTPVPENSAINLGPNLALVSFALVVKML